MWLGLGRVLDVSLREVQHVLQYMHAWITDLAACLEIFEDPIYLSFPQRETLGQRIFCSLLEMHQPWSSRIKMIQCFKIYRALLDYVGLFYFVWFAVLNFGLVQETPCWELIYCVKFHTQLIIHTYDWHWLNNCSSLLFLFVCFHAPILYSMLMDPFIHTAGVYVLCAYGFLDTWTSMCPHLFLSPVSVYLIAVGWDICIFVYAYILQKGRSVDPHTMDWRRARQACTLLHVEEK